MEVVYKRVNDPDSVVKLCEIAHKSHLYINGWLLQGWYKNPDTVKCIVLAEVDKVYVGCAVLKTSNNTGVYVKPKYRRKGIGTELLKQLTKNYSGVFGIDYYPVSNAKVKQAFFEKAMKHKSVKNIFGGDLIW